VNNDVKHIVDTDGELSQEWFGVRNADLLSVVLAASLNGVKKCRTTEPSLRFSARGIEKLGCVSANGLHFGFVCVRDVYDKRGMKFVPLHEFEVVVRTVWLLWLSPGARGELSKTGVKPCFPAELIGVGMIRMPLDSVWNNKHRRSQFPYEGDHLPNILFVDFHVAVWNLEVPASKSTQNVRGLFRFL
jgi:prepilin-type processing-associated H-X9-DG protein